MRRLALILIIATVPAPAGAACHTTPPQIATEARTAALSAAAPSPTPEAPGRYSAAVSAAYRLETAGQGDCAHITAARVVFTLAARVDIHPSHRTPCRAAIIAEHEAAHAEADRAALAATRQRIERDLSLLLSPPVSAEAAHEAMRLYLASAGQRYGRERDHAHSLIDSPAAMAHAAARLRSCHD